MKLQRIETFLDFGWLPTKRTCGCPEGRLNCLTRPEIIALGSTVIDEKRREKWREYHGGRFIPKVPEKFIKLFSHPGETVLDPFCGSGTTNVVAKQLGRNSIGIDINRYSVELTLHRLEQLNWSGEALPATKHQIVQGNCVEVLAKIPPNSIDLIVTSPPYFDVVDYKDNDPEQWGNIHDYQIFLEKMALAFEKLYRTLKHAGHLVVVTQDVYKRYAKCPLHADYILICRNLGFEVISTQVYILNYSTGGRLVYGYPKSYYPKNDHEFIVIFRKPVRREALSRVTARP
jgi:DNA modification methylase